VVGVTCDRNRFGNATIPTHEHTGLRSPKTLSTRTTCGQNLHSKRDFAGNAHACAARTFAAVRTIPVGAGDLVGDMQRLAFRVAVIPATEFGGALAPYEFQEHIRCLPALLSGYIKVRDRSNRPRAKGEKEDAALLGLSHDGLRIGRALSQAENDNVCLDRAQV